MNLDADIVRQEPDHAEFYHRTQIESVRAEGERLRRELRRRGVDPTLILIEAGKMAGKAAVRLTVLLLSVLSCYAQVPLTSDSAAARLLPQPNPGIYPGRAAQYVPPQMDYFYKLETNIRPIVVEITVISNRMLRVAGYLDGKLDTNELVLSSNLVARTTNTVTLP